MERTRSTSSRKASLTYSPSPCSRTTSTGRTGRTPMWNARISTPEVTEPPLDPPSTDQWTSRSTTSLDKLLSRRIRFAIHELLIKTALMMSANVGNCMWVKAASYRSKFLTGQQLLFMSCSSGSSDRVGGGGGARNMKST